MNMMMHKMFSNRLLLTGFLSHVLNLDVGWISWVIFIVNSVLPKHSVCNADCYDTIQTAENESWLCRDVRCKLCSLASD